MAITLNDQLYSFSPKALDGKYGKQVGADTVPFASVAEANATIPFAYRHRGLMVTIDTGSGNTLYWYKDGKTDGDLVPFNAASGPDTNFANTDLTIAANRLHTVSPDTSIKIGPNTSNQYLEINGGTGNEYIGMDMGYPNSQYSNFYVDKFGVNGTAFKADGTSNYSSSLNLKNYASLSLYNSDTSKNAEFTAQVDADTTALVKVTDNTTSVASGIAVTGTGITISDMSATPGNTNLIIDRLPAVTGTHVLYIDDSTGSVSKGLLPNTPTGITGGVVTWISGLTFHVTAADYYIDGVHYTSPATDITLDAADGTNPRLDVLAVTSAGTVVKITGTAGATPAEPQVDYFTQLKLTSILLNAGATTPVGIIENVIYDEGVEWAGTSQGTISANFLSSAITPFRNSFEVETANYADQSGIMFSNNVPVGISNDKTLNLHLYSTEAFTGTSDIKVQFLKNGVAVSDVRPLPFVKTTVGLWQYVSFRLTDFVFTSPDFNQVKFILTGASATRFVYWDYIVLQDGIVQPGGSTPPLQGLQNVITVDPVLTVSNTIQTGNNSLEFNAGDADQSLPYSSIYLYKDFMRLSSWDDVTSLSTSVFVSPSSLKLSNVGATLGVNMEITTTGVTIQHETDPAKNVALSVFVNGTTYDANAAGLINLGTIGGGSSYTFSNGITETTGAVKLGGTLTQTTDFDAVDTHAVRFFNTSVFGVYIDQQATGNIIFDATDLSFNNPQITVTPAKAQMAYLPNDKATMTFKMEYAGVTLDMGNGAVNPLKIINLASGTAANVLYIDSTTGTVTKGAAPAGSSYTFTNGLTETTGTVELGGTLTKVTIIDGNAGTWPINFNNMGDFNVQTKVAGVGPSLTALHPTTSDYTELQLTTVQGYIKHYGDAFGAGEYNGFIANDNGLTLHLRNTTSGVLKMENVATATAANVLYIDPATGVVTQNTAPSGGGSTAPVDITYSALSTAISGSTLIPGTVYRLTDFQTVHTIYNTTDTNTGPTEVLLLTALTTNELAPVAYSESYPDDMIYYNPTNDTTVMPGCTKGFIYRRIDTKRNNDLPTDFRAVKYRRWAATVAAWSSGTTYSRADKVSYNSKIWMSAQGSNTNNTPTGSSDAWWVDTGLVPTSLFLYGDDGFSPSGWTADAATFQDYLLFDATSYANGNVLNNKVDYSYDVSSGVPLTNVINNVFTGTSSRCKNNTVDNGSDWRSNVFLSNSKFEGNTITNYGKVTNNFVSAGGGMWNNFVSDSRMSGNVLNGASIYENTLTSNAGIENNVNYFGDIDYNTISKSSSINGNYGDFSCYQNSLDNYANMLNNTLFQTPVISCTGNGAFLQNAVLTKFTAGSRQFVYNNFRSANGASGQTWTNTETLVYANQLCDIYKRPDGTWKLSYMNNSDTLTVTAITT